MLSIEFLWAMKGKISVFTTFMIAKYFYVRVARASILLRCSRARLLFVGLALLPPPQKHSHTPKVYISAKQPPLFSSLFLMASARFIVSICFEWVFSVLLRSIPQLKCWKWAKVRFILWIFDTLLHSLTHTRTHFQSTILRYLKPFKPSSSSNSDSSIDSIRMLCLWFHHRHRHHHRNNNNTAANRAI